MTTLANKTFKVNSLEFEYCTHPYNDSWKNERTIEISVAKWAMDWMYKKNLDVLELGDVLWNYFGGEVKHTVVDLYETPRPGLINTDIVEYNYAGKSLISVSTIEHLYHREHGHDELIDPGMSQKVLERIFAVCPYYFITLPRRHRQELDEFVYNCNVPKTLLNRQPDGTWKQDDWNTYFCKFYSGLCYNVSILTNLPEFWV